MTLEKLKAYIAKATTNGHVIVFIDHIGLIGVKAHSSYERMTEIAKELRKMSLDYDCTIIGLCQLNRDATKGSKEPSLSMLRDSGEVEQSANKVLFIWKYNDEYSLRLEKNRSGSNGAVNIEYLKHNQIIRETNSWVY